MHVNLTDKRYYSIGEVAKAFNVKPSLLRFWEKEFKEIQPKKKTEWNPKVHSRKYFDHSVLYHLVKEKGMTLEGAKKQMQVKSTDSHKQLILSKLEKIKDSLEKLKEKL